MINKQKFYLKALRFFPPEFAHKITLKVIKHNLVAEKINDINQSKLNIKLGNLNFNHPLGIAAGFDKNIETINTIHKLGISHMEFGTTTPNPQLGNKKPRVFRLSNDSAIINRLGFPNHGSDEAIKKLHNNKSLLPIGVNIGCNKNSINLQSDYSILTEKLGPFCEWLTINVSSPNTPNLRELQKKENLKKLLSNIVTIRKKIEDKNNKTFQLWLKISPDITDLELKNIIDTSVEYKIDAICISNSTISRNFKLTSRYKNENGGLSGAPLYNHSTKMLAKAYLHSNNKIKFIGIGGISNGENAYNKILAGATLIQIYTGLVFNGPKIIKDIVNYLSIKCENKNLNDLIGTNAKSIILKN